MSDHITAAIAAASAPDGIPPAVVATPVPASDPAPTEATETTEEGEGEPEPAPVPEKPKHEPWYQQRIRAQAAKLAYEQTRAETAEREREALRTQLARFNGQQQGQVPQDNAPQQPVQTPQDIERIIAEREEGRQFNERSNAVFAEGVASNPDFAAKINDLGQIGVEQPKYVEFLKDVITLPNSAAVLYTLASDLDHAAHVLSLPPRQQAMALATISASLAAGAGTPQQAVQATTPPPAVTISRAPAPVKPIAGRSSASTGDVFDTKQPMDAWVKAFDKKLRG
jgi:hypothetical protein